MHSRASLPKPCLADAVFDYAGEVPERIALASEYGQTTYAELAQHVKRLGAALIRVGVKEGDRVAILTTPRADAYAVFVALNTIGAIWVGINPVYKYREMEYVVKDSAPVALIFLASFQGRDYTPDARKLMTECESLQHSYCLDQSLPGIESIDQLIAGNAVGEDPPLPERRPDNVAMIVYTSGSTGDPKGCMLANKAMAYRAKVQYEQYPVSDYPRVYCPLPLNHVGGMQMVAAAALFNGGTVNFREKFDPSSVGKVVAECKVNYIILFPTMYQLICDDPAFNNDDFASLEIVNFAGGTIAKELLMKLLKMGSGDVRTCFGSTETCIGVIFSEAGLDPDTLAISVGRPIADDVRIMGKDGKECRVGEVGEFQVIRDYCMSGYFNRPEATAEAFTDDGYVKTGDLVEELPDGNFRFVARISDMFKSGGYNVYPREVEIAIEEHPDVVAAAVVGVPHPLYSEVGYAFVLREPDSELAEDQVRDLCTVNLANYKVPKTIELVDAFPLLPNGKMDRTRLREIAIDKCKSEIGE